MPIRLIGGRMNVFNTISHISKPNWSSKSSRDGIDVVSLNINEVAFIMSIEEKFDMDFGSSFWIFENSEKN